MLQYRLAVKSQLAGLLGTSPFRSKLPRSLFHHVNGRRPRAIFTLESFDLRGDLYGSKSPRPSYRCSLWKVDRNTSIFFKTGQTYKCATCRCSCGIEKPVRKDHLTAGRTKSCGCAKSEASKNANTVHGMFGTSVYKSWSGMLSRCTCVTDQSYARYGGRGIKVDPEWHTFSNFYRDMGEKPFKGASLERLNTNGDYCLANCVWADNKTQSYNKRNNTLFEYKGQKYNVSALAELSGLAEDLLRSRLYKRKWSIERAVETPKIHPSENGRPAPKSQPATRYKLYSQS